MFSFFAIVTSFLGVALGCVDFMGDVLKGMPGFKKAAAKSKASPKVGTPVGGAQSEEAAPTPMQRLIPMGIMITPALFVAVCAPTAFLPALEYSGTLRLILFGMMPAIMVWKIRHGGVKLGGGGGGKLTAPPWVKGGKAVLAFIIAFASGIISLELGGKIFRAMAAV